VAIPLNAKAIYSFLRAEGFSLNAAAGILGNIEQESGGNPAESGGGLIQILQGNPGYTSSTSLKAQLAGVMAYIRANGSVADINAHASSPSAAALYFSQKYERPGIPDNQNRIASAQEVAAAAKSGNWSTSSNLSSGSSGTPSDDATNSLSAIGDFISEANGLFKDVAEVVNWFVVMAEPSQQWRLISAAGSVAAFYGSVRFHRDNFPLSVFLMGAGAVLAYMALRPWPQSASSTPERPGPYAVSVVQGEPPAAGPAPASHVGEIQAGVEALAGVWAVGQVAKGLANVAEAGGLAAGIGKLFGDLGSDAEDIGEGAEG
jgi:Phage tail lysozyme